MTDTPGDRAVATPPDEDTDHESLTAEEETAIQDRWDANTPTLSELKTERKREIKREARQVLSETDWYVARHHEQEIRGQSTQGLPTTVTDHRDRVRTLEGQAVDEIDAADSKDAVRAVTVDWPAPPEPPL